jgi:hypothetical protein
VERRADHPFADRLIDGAGGPLVKALRQHQRAATLTAAGLEVPQAPERPELILDVADAIGDHERARPGREGLGRRALRVHEGQAERRPELHLAARVTPRAGAEAGQRPLGAPAPLD